MRILLFGLILISTSVFADQTKHFLTNNIKFNKIILSDSGVQDYLVERIEGLNKLNAMLKKDQDNVFLGIEYSRMGGLDNKARRTLKFGSIYNIEEQYCVHVEVDMSDHEVKIIGKQDLCLKPFTPKINLE
ncbi:MAG: hypothetical protein KC478_13160 [Bacteriovoracaceae bacterium]|nr:hypothetical protein [Bacteriovoracaceae bacterium]